MGGFAAPKNATKGTTRRKVAHLMAVHLAVTVRRAEKTDISLVSSTKKR